MNIAVREALLAMGLISFAPSLARWIMIKESMSSRETLIISTFVAFLFLFCERWFQGDSPYNLLSSFRGVLLSCLLGIIFGGALYFYYSALNKGTVMLVVPIWGLQIVGASIVALFVFQEEITFFKLISVLFASISIFFAIRQ